MKHLFTLLTSFTLFTVFSACQRHNQPATTGEYYEYELLNPAQVYSNPVNGNTRLADLPAGTRVTSYGPLASGTYRSVEYNGYNVMLYQPDWYATRTSRAKRITAYKLISTYTTYNGPCSKVAPSGLPIN